MLNVPRGGGGGEGTQQSFTQGGFTLQANPLPYFIPFLTEEETPFIYLPLKNGTPLATILKG